MKVLYIVTTIIIFVFCLSEIKSCSECISSGGKSVRGVIGYECIE